MNVFNYIIAMSIRSIIFLLLNRPVLFYKYLLVIILNNLNEWCYPVFV